MAIELPGSSPYRFESSVEPHPTVPLRGPASPPLRLPRAVAGGPSAERTRSDGSIFERASARLRHLAARKQRISNDEKGVMAVSRVSRNTKLLRAIVNIALSLLAVTVLSGCSAGQVTQTATQDRDKTGGFGQVGDIAIRAVQLAYPPDGVYQPGDEAELSMAIVNSGTVDDRLVSISGEPFSGVTVNGSRSSTPTPADSRAASPASDSPTTTTNATVTSASTGEVPIPAGESVFIGMGGPTITLTGITERIDAAHFVQLALTFARAGHTTVTAIVEPAPEPLPPDPVIEF
ncbi:copper chaperone PCu(A)C [Blastococcus sp. CT_GayMR20]|uniref:copper chaperone PCu(A)C n=1 Tax=Blastococcus sp. CT_GayMR20 TaxID=2559609 RepID=UPI0010744D82|nr:copper chaperone PCu(A)C [Blastococcus sp. CT_GayMR20]TFV88463.1 copper chaperone PCu(A)C [Blastococcus sp. CT_GayMR20]